MPKQSKDNRRSILAVEGGHELAGLIDVKGNKNSALPLLAACLLTEEKCELTNVPGIKDVDVMLDLLSGLGAVIEWKGSTTLTVQCANLSSDEPDPWLVGRLRGPRSPGAPLPSYAYQSSRLVAAVRPRHGQAAG